MSGEEQYSAVQLATLELVGDAIVALGGERPEELPVGFCRSPLDCVISRAFRASLPQPIAVYGDCIIVSDRGDAVAIAVAWNMSFQIHPMTMVEEEMRSIFGDTDAVYQVFLPNLLQDFVSAFDAGEFPNLDAELLGVELSQWFVDPPVLDSEIISIFPDRLSGDA